MQVKEIVKVADGRQIVLNLNDEEHTYLLSLGVNYAIAKGMLTLGVVEGTEVIGDDKETLQ
jgi:hypothetical protein